MATRTTVSSATFAALSLRHRRLHFYNNHPNSLLTSSYEPPLISLSASSSTLFPFEDDVAGTHEEEDDLAGPEKEELRYGFEARVVEVRRITKAGKGGKQKRLRAVVVVGDKSGSVGVGVGKAKEKVAAVLKSVVDARRNIVAVPVTKSKTSPHR